MWEAILAFLTEYTEEAGAAGGLLAVVGFLWAIIKKPFSKDKPVELGPKTVEQLKPEAPSEVGPKLTIPEFIRLRRELKADLEAELAQADDAEKQQLRARIAELEKQIADPEPALKEAQQRIRDLEALLERDSNEIGTERIAEARAALEQGDYSIADEIFAELEARTELAVQTAARAAFGRGEVAEAEIRWLDAAKHYAKAARLAPDFDTLRKASEFTQRAGDYTAAAGYSTDLLAFVRGDGTQEQLTDALNQHAANTYFLGDFAKAEIAFREALEIDRLVFGANHQEFATRLNNLALVVKAQGRFAEAEGLYREALEIDRATIGEAHPDYAIDLNNLAGVVEAQGRFAEAEGLYRAALEITRAALGEAHPSFAIRLGNLGDLLGKMGQVAEGRDMLTQALEIFRASLPPEHPDIAHYQALLDALPPD